MNISLTTPVASSPKKLDVVPPKQMVEGPLDPANFLEQLKDTEVASASFYKNGFANTHRQLLVATGELVGPKDGFASFYDAGNAIGEIVAGDPSAAAIVKVGDHFFGVGLKSFKADGFASRAGEWIDLSKYGAADLETNPGYEFGSLNTQMTALSQVVDGHVHLAGPELTGHVGKQ